MGGERESFEILEVLRTILKSVRKLNGVFPVGESYHLLPGVVELQVQHPWAQLHW